MKIFNNFVYQLKTGVLGSLSEEWLFGLYNTPTNLIRKICFQMKHPSGLVCYQIIADLHMKIPTHCVIPDIINQNGNGSRILVDKRHNREKDQLE